MERLPNELLIKIFERLSGSDLEACYYVNRRWSYLIEETPSIWKGDASFKVIGTGPMQWNIIKHLQLFKHLRYLDLSNHSRPDFFDHIISIILENNKCLEVIRLKDPDPKYINGFFLIKSLKELYIVIYKLKFRDARLRHMRLLYNIKVPFDFRFHNELIYVWKPGTGFELVS